jgi:magnesium chelatase family protein
MPSIVVGGALQGVDAIPIEVEVDLLRRLPSICIVGLATSAVKESSERIRSAISCAVHEFPRKRVVVNLMPADVRKDTTALDLPMALGILAANDTISAQAVSTILAAGELSLGGRLRPVRGAMSLAVLARDLGLTLLVPHESATLASMVPGVKVVGARTLGEVVSWLRGEDDLPAVPLASRTSPSQAPDLVDVVGQAHARHALEVSAAGAHHLLMVGPPGCGKSMLAQRLPSILPPPTFSEALSASRIHHAAGLLDEAGGLLNHRPFRAPHHSVTVAGMVGDRTLRPGELSLAHTGVLFLDEAPEFSRSVLEVLRQPLEDGRVQITRAAGTITYPAALTLVLACNPCPCGNRGLPGACHCTDSAVDRYLRKLSGPVLDRVDLHVGLSPVPYSDLVGGSESESSADVRERVLRARQRQEERGQSVPNAQLEPCDLARHASFGPEAGKLLQAGAEQHRMSARSMTRTVKVARTLADLANSPAIGAQHIAGALTFRQPSLVSA